MRSQQSLYTVALCLLSACGGGSGGGGVGTDGPGAGVNDPPAPYIGRSTHGLVGSLPLTGVRCATTAEGALWLSSTAEALTELDPAGEFVGQWDISGLPGERAFVVRHVGPVVLAGRAGNPMSVGNFGTDGPTGDWIEVSASGQGDLRVIRVDTRKLYIAGIVDGRVQLGLLADDRTLEWQLSLQPEGLGSNARVSLEADGEDELLLWVAPSEGAESTYLARLGPGGEVLFEVELDAALGTHEAGRTWSLREGHSWSLLEAGSGSICQPGDRALIGVSLTDGAPVVQQQLHLEREHLLGWGPLPAGGHLLVGGHRGEGDAETSLWCARLEADGSLAWQLAYPVAAPGACAADVPLYANQEADSFSNGDLLVTARTGLARGYDGTGRLVMRLDSATGNPVWAQALADTLGSVELRSARVLPNDRVLLAGMTERLAFDPVRQPFVALLDRGGQLLESFVLPSPERGAFERLIQVEDGSYFALGPYGNPGQLQCTVAAHLGADGLFQWGRRIGDPELDEVLYGDHLSVESNQLVLHGSTGALGGNGIPSVQSLAGGYDTNCQRPIPANPNRLQVTPLELTGVPTSVTTSSLDLVHPLSSAGTGALSVTPLSPRAVQVPCEAAEICF